MNSICRYSTYALSTVLLELFDGVGVCEHYFLNITVKKSLA